MQILALSLLVPGEGCAVQTVQAWNVLCWEQRGFGVDRFGEV